MVENKKVKGEKRKQQEGCSQGNEKRAKEGDGETVKRGKNLESFRYLPRSPLDQWAWYLEENHSLQKDLSGGINLLDHFLKPKIIQNDSQPPSAYWKQMLAFLLIIADAAGRNTVSVQPIILDDSQAKQCISQLSQIISKSSFRPDDYKNALYALFFFITRVEALTSELVPYIERIIQKIKTKDIKFAKVDVEYFKYYYSFLKKILPGDYLQELTQALLGFDSDEFYLNFCDDYERLPLPEPEKYILCHSPPVCKDLFAANGLTQQDRTDTVNTGLKDGGVQTLDMSMKYLPIIFQEIIYAVEVEKDKSKVEELLNIIKEKGVDEEYSARELADARELYEEILKSMERSEFEGLLNVCCEVRVKREYMEDIVVTPRIIRAFLSQFYMQIKMTGNVFVMGLPQHHGNLNGFCIHCALQLKNEHKKVILLEIVDPEVFPFEKKNGGDESLPEELNEEAYYKRELIGPRGEKRTSAKPIHPAMKKIVEKIKAQVNSSLASNLVVDMWLSLGFDSHVAEESFSGCMTCEQRKDMFFNDRDFKYFFDEMAKLWNNIPDDYRGNFKENLEGGYNRDVLRRISREVLPGFYQNLKTGGNNMSKERSMIVVDIDVNHGNGLKSIVEKHCVTHRPKSDIQQSVSTVFGDRNGSQSFDDFRPLIAVK